MNTVASTQSGSNAEKGIVRRAFEFIKPGLVGMVSLGSVLVFFPLLVLGSAATLVFIMWPMFLGAYLEYGFVPGTSVRSVGGLGLHWYILTFVWIVALIVGSVSGGRYWAERQYGRGTERRIN